VRGVHDDAAVIGELHQKLEAIGLPTYYLF
jgi:L-lysine 2,3-aminomutase